MQAWQIHGSCRLPLHLRYPGHQDLSCLLRIVQTCVNGILQLQVTRRSIVEGEGNVLWLPCPTLYASQWISDKKLVTSCKLWGILSLTFIAEVCGGQWPCHGLGHVAVSHLREWGGMHLLPLSWPKETHLTAVWVPLAPAALGQVFRDWQ